MNLVDMITKRLEVDLAELRDGRGDFAAAIRAIKHGAAVARSGWNGKNMFVFMGKTASFACEFDGSEHMMRDVSQADLRPAIFMRDAQKCIVTGWLASQTDMLAEDWCIVHEPRTREGSQ